MLRTLKKWFSRDPDSRIDVWADEKGWFVVRVFPNRKHEIVKRFSSRPLAVKHAKQLGYREMNADDLYRSQFTLLGMRASKNARKMDRAYERARKKKKVSDKAKLAKARVRMARQKEAYERRKKRGR